jgi:hypothetical protein
MKHSRLFPSVVLVALLGFQVLADETVGVSGSSVEYPTQVEAMIGDKRTSLKLTGAAMRKKLLFNVYTVGSYVQADFRGKTAEELAGADTLKQLHLVMQRDVSGKDMAKAFGDAIRANYANEFADEVDKFMALMRDQSADTDDHVWITHVPGFGLHVNLVGKKAEYIKSVKFAHAVWNIYLGPKNVGENVKKGLTSRL